jgi:hypothetical protein
VEAILLELALAMARELEAVTDAAPDGRVLAEGEATALRLGPPPAEEAPRFADRPPRGGWDRARIHGQVILMMISKY